MVHGGKLSVGGTNATTPSGCREDRQDNFRLSADLPGVSDFHEPLGRKPRLLVAGLRSDLALLLAPASEHLPEPLESRARGLWIRTHPGAIPLN